MLCGQTGDISTERWHEYRHDQKISPAERDPMSVIARLSYVALFSSSRVARVIGASKGHRFTTRYKHMGNRAEGMGMGYEWGGRGFDIY